MMNEVDIAIIGGGASGLVSAISAKRENPKARVAVLEHSSRVGKKILATGNGRCNLTNINCRSQYYHSSSNKTVESILSRYDSRFIMDFFAQMGMLYKIDNEGRVYPYSEQASAVLDILRAELQHLNIEEICDFSISSIKKQKGKFIIQSENHTLSSKEIIVATGGKASPSLGSDGSGYKYLKDFGHTMTNVFPALVQVTVTDNITHSLKGVRANCTVCLVADKNVMRTETGEIQFSENALSGICIFQLSRMVSEFCCTKSIFGQKYKNLSINVDLLPQHTYAEVFNLIKSKIDFNRDLLLENLFVGMLNKKVGQALIKICGISQSKKVSDLSKMDINNLVSIIKCWKFSPNGTMPWKNAQVTAGGIRCDEFDINTLESKKSSGLFAAGEVLDVDGDCGGFNLQWAWSSGYIAGKSAAKKLKS